MGRSGTGKSTLLRALGLFHPFDAGSYRLLGSDVAGLSDRACSTLRARHIGFVFQEFRLLPHLSATGNVETAAALAGLPRPRATPRGASRRSTSWACRIDSTRGHARCRAESSSGWRWREPWSRARR